MYPQLAVCFLIYIYPNTQINCYNTSTTISRNIFALNGHLSIRVTAPLAPRVRKTHREEGQ